MYSYTAVDDNDKEELLRKHTFPVMCSSYHHQSLIRCQAVKLFTHHHASSISPILPTDASKMVDYHL